VSTPIKRTQEAAVTFVSDHHLAACSISVGERLNARISPARRAFTNASKIERVFITAPPLKIYL
jgi:hypothetical protein